MNEDEFRCEKCNWIWQFCPEDYDWMEEDYPTTCPLCNMDFWDMVKDVYEKDGIKEVLRRIYLRITL